MGVQRPAGHHYVRRRPPPEREAEAFPGDPCRGDFALYGPGIDEE